MIRHLRVIFRWGGKKKSNRTVVLSLSLSEK